MDKTKDLLKKLVLYIYLRRHLALFFFSFLSLIFMLITLFNSNLNFIQTEITFIKIFFQIILIFNTAFIILFLPSYPIFFIIFKNKKFNFLEKLSLTIVSNLVFYILIGYVANYFRISITGLFYGTVIIIVYFCIIFYIIFIELKKGSLIFLKTPKISLINKDNCKNISILNFIKKRLSFNVLLLTIFLILFAILNGIRFSYFYGTDAMYHVFIIKLIVKLNFLPLSLYNSSLGLHIFGAVIIFFTNGDLFFLAKYFSFYTFFVSALILYNILMRIFKNRNLAILGIFFLEISSLGFSNMMYQFWPSALATILSLYIFFLLYVRLETLMKERVPTKRDLFSDLIFTYVFIILIFISALFTHSLISTIYLVSFAFIFLVYFAKSYKRGFDFIVICFCLSVFFVLYNTTKIGKHWMYIDFFQLPWYLLIFSGIIGLLIVLKLRTGIKFKKNRFMSTILGHKYKYYKTVEDKLVFPLLFLCIIIFSIIFAVAFSISTLLFTNTLIVLECIIVIYFGIWGLILIQKKPRGKPLALWFVAFVIIFFISFSLDCFVPDIVLSGRIVLMQAPVYIFGFISYLYKVIKLKSITKLKIKMLILGIVIFTFFAQFSDQLLDTDDIEYNLYRREVYSLQWFSNYTSDPNFVISEFGIPYVIMYYKYPYEKKNQSIGVYDLFTYDQTPKGFFKPVDHFNANGTNKLQEMKKRLNKEVYLILDDNYLAFTGFDVYERLSEEEMEEYYYMNYLNKICSSKSVNGIEFPYYWVI